MTTAPIGIGACTGNAAVKALKGEKLPKITDTGFYFVRQVQHHRPQNRSGSVRLRLVQPSGHQGTFLITPT